MGCFNPASSDIDLLAVARRTIPAKTKCSLIELLLSVSGSPHPVEISFLLQADLAQWQYPTPFDLHFSEDWRKAFSADRAAHEWKHLREQPHCDPDLAAHITITTARGIAVWGEPIEAVFPPVPREDYLAASVSDLRWAREQLVRGVGLEYAVLNSCHVLAYLYNGQIGSKDEGAMLALSLLPDEYHPTIRRALARYRGHDAGNKIADPRLAERLLNEVLERAAP